MFVLNKDSSRVYANNNNFMGYLIADVASGQIIKTVEVTSVDWRSKWNTTPRPRIPHGCPSHGIALTPDEKEVWVTDGIFNKIHIFSNTDDPKEIDTIDTPGGTYWLTLGLDGTLMYSSSGDVIDVKTHKIVGALKDEYGRPPVSYTHLSHSPIPADAGPGEELHRGAVRQGSGGRVTPRQGVGRAHQESGLAPVRRVLGPVLEFLVTVRVRGSVLPDR